MDRSATPVEQAAVPRQAVLDALSATPDADGRIHITADMATWLRQRLEQGSIQASIEGPVAQMSRHPVVKQIQEHGLTTQVPWVEMHTVATIRHVPSASQRQVEVEPGTVLLGISQRRDAHGKPMMSVRYQDEPGVIATTTAGQGLPSGPHVIPGRWQIQIIPTADQNVAPEQREADRRERGRWIAWYLNTHDGRQRMDQRCTMGSVATMFSSHDLLKLPIPMLADAEARQVITGLRASCDALVDNHNKVNALFGQIADAVDHQMIHGSTPAKRG